MRWKIQRPGRWKWAAIISLLVVVIVTISRPRSTRYNLANVHPSLRSLATPYRSVTTACFSDGSIGLQIVDRDRKRESFALPVGAGPGHNYSSLFAGDMSAKGFFAVQIPFSDDTRKMLTDIISRHVNDSDDSEFALSYLRGSTWDFVRFWLYMLRMRLKSLW